MLIPSDPSREALYVLAQKIWASDKHNLVTWRWMPDRQLWASVGKSPSHYSPQRMDEAGWEMVEETTEIVWDVTDIYGRRLDDYTVG